MVSMTMLAIFTAFLLFAVTIGDDRDQNGFFNISWPSYENDIHWIRMSFSEDGENFLVNMKITGDHWCSLGFADGPDDTMQGIDAWVYGDFGGDGLEVLEFALGDHEIGDMDASQNLDVKSIYQSGGTTQVRVDRALNTGNRDDYVITEGGIICIMYAFGELLQVESGHNITQRGIECFELDGETPEPTPAPTYVPTPSPSDSPTLKPTKEPTIFGQTARPTPEPTNRPTQSPTTSAPTLSPTNPISGIPSRAPTPAPTRPPTRDLSAPTPSPSLQPSKSPTLTFRDDSVDPTDADVSEKDDSDAFEVWTWLIVGLLALLVVCLLGAICFCYERNRRIRKKRLEEKEKAYEEIENFKAKNGLDIPDNGPVPVRDEDDNRGVGYVGKSAQLPDEDSDDDDDDADNQPAYAPPVNGGSGAVGSGGLAAGARKNDRGPKHKNERKKPAYRKKDLKVDDDDDVDLARPSEEITDALIDNDHESRQSKFVDVKQEKKEKIRKDKIGKDKEAIKEGKGDDDDDYDYEAAKQEREERKRKRQREARRKRASARKAKAGKFGVFNDDQW